MIQCIRKKNIAIAIRYKWVVRFGFNREFIPKWGFTIVNEIIPHYWSRSKKNIESLWLRDFSFNLAYNWMQKNRQQTFRGEPTISYGGCKDWKLYLILRILVCLKILNCYKYLCKSTDKKIPLLIFSHLIAYIVFIFIFIYQIIE